MTLKELHVLVTVAISKPQCYMDCRELRVLRGCGLVAPRHAHDVTYVTAKGKALLGRVLALMGEETTGDLLKASIGGNARSTTRSKFVQRVRSGVGTKAPDTARSRTRKAVRR